MSMNMSIFSIHYSCHEYIFYTLLTPTHSNHELPCVSNGMSSMQYGGVYLKLYGL